MSIVSLTTGQSISTGRNKNSVNFSQLGLIVEGKNDGGSIVLGT